MAPGQNFGFYSCLFGSCVVFSFADALAFVEIILRKEICLMSLIDKFDGALTDSGVKPQTTAAYLSDIRLFYRYFDASEIEVLSAKEDAVCEFLRWMKDQGFKDSSRSRALSSLRKFYTFLISSGVISFNPAGNIRKPAPRRDAGEILTREEVDRLLGAPALDTPKGIRDSAILELLYATGMTASELVMLDTEDYISSPASIRIHGEKSHRILPLYSRVCRKLDRYLQSSRSVFAGGSEAALFVNRNGERLTRQGVWKIVGEYSGHAGVEKSVTPKSLRRALAAHLTDNGVTPEELMEVLGYESKAAVKVLMDSFRTTPVSPIFRLHPHAKR